ncbi:NAD(P)/FAD-dependent oxidoreductase [Brevundimonas abyssalis]|uniref:Ferredoxin reductase n=1 Tax=Brevundimonas abyssalis TAR-001 TaxID=1391729 RepID=A0A8E0NBP6_9CAUL|nr:FAD-dependent oxidoreductase [Brevundimonas abyssalis]GAD59400.1 ferredoxin reductase [Brevundimonas abyssalis TAR-001]
MSKSDHFDVLIIGAGHAGAQTAIALRQQKFEGTIGIVGDETEHPYERPPLSKDYFLGEKTFDRLLIRPESFWRERKVSLMLGHRAVSLDADARTIFLQDGAKIGYGDLVWAAGGRARRLSCPGFDLGGIHYVRTRADVDALLEDAEAATRVAVIGGGYIGLEAAASLSKLGKAVTLFETADRLLARVAGAPISHFYADAHRRRGVAVLTSINIVEVLGEQDRVFAVRSDHHTFPCDLVIVGIGIIPESEVLAKGGAKVENGVWVDAHGATSLPHVYAAGDCAAGESQFADGARLRIESVQNANDTATSVASSIMGAPRPYAATPWFWSNQFDLKLQTVGLCTGHDEAVVRGDPETESFSVIYLKQGRVIALDCVNNVKDYVQGRKLVELGLSPALSAIVDSDIPLKNLLPPTA